MKDAHGFDPDETYTQPDNPFWDCTDSAHPAWWRGEEAGVRGAVDVLQKIIDTGEHTGVFGSADLEKLAQDILRLKGRVTQ